MDPPASHELPRLGPFLDPARFHQLYLEASKDGIVPSSKIVLEHLMTSLDPLMVRCWPRRTIMPHNGTQPIKFSSLQLPCLEDFVNEGDVIIDLSKTLVDGDSAFELFKSRALEVEQLVNLNVRRPA
jgi:hypothetical protein